jgi:hypothetical protein
LNAALYSGLNALQMEHCFAQRLQLIAKQPLPGAARTLYAWSR